jgi:hypothetical protein
MSNPIDDFAARAQAVLGKTDPKKLADLLSLRADTHRFAAQRWPGLSAPGAEALNARNQHLIDQAAALLGPDHFQKIFGLDPRAKLTLVDPKMVPRPVGIPSPEVFSRVVDRGRRSSRSRRAKPKNERAAVHRSGFLKPASALYPSSAERRNMLERSCDCLRRATPGVWRTSGQVTSIKNR